MPENATQPPSLRMCYIGVVSLLCHAHMALGRERQADFDHDSQMEKVAADFNRQGFGLSMQKAVNGWGLFGTAGEPSERHHAPATPIDPDGSRA